MLIQTQPKASTSSVVLVNGKLTQTASLPLSGGRVKKFKCIFPGCDKSYTRPVRLEEHVRTHTGEVSTVSLARVSRGGGAVGRTPLGRQVRGERIPAKHRTKDRSPLLGKQSVPGRSPALGGTRADR